MSPICLEILKGCFTLVAVGLGSLIALKAFFRQKEYELTKQRYLEGGVDVVAVQIEQALGVVSHNWARCLAIAKSFRDAGSDFDIKELEKGFLEFDSSQFKQIAHHRIGSLVRSQVIWRVFQHAMAYATNANSRICKEIPEAIRLRMTTDRIAADHGEVAEQMFQDLQGIQKEGYPFANLLREVHALGLLLEAERMSLKAVADFSNKQEVRELISRLEASFPEESGADAA